MQDAQESQQRRLFTDPCLYNDVPEMYTQSLVCETSSPHRDYRLRNLHSQSLRNDSTAAGSANEHHQ